MNTWLAGVPESVSQARHLVRRILGDDHPAVQYAALCASELATNAVTHTRSGLPGGSFGPGASAPGLSDPVGFTDPAAGR